MLYMLQVDFTDKCIWYVRVKMTIQTAKWIHAIMSSAHAS